jgi:Beta-lactamase enzyme family
MCAPPRHSGAVFSAFIGGNGADAVAPGDLVVLMLTISDNHAADALLRRVGVGAVNATAARLGLTSTVVESDLRTMLDSIGQDLGRVSWADLLTWQAEASVEEVARADQRLLAVRALDPARGTRTTARDMVRLLRLIWIGRAGPAAACDRVRALMARQLTRHRIASGFRPPVKVAAKSGGLLGIVRNEIGVISYPDGRQYAAAVFTRSQPGSDDAAIAARHPARGRLGFPRGHRGGDGDAGLSRPRAGGRDPGLGRRATCTPWASWPSNARPGRGPPGPRPGDQVAVIGVADGGPVRCAAAFRRCRIGRRALRCSCC